MSRWSVLLTLVAVVGIALAGAATPAPSPSAHAATIVAAAPATTDAVAADPYVAGTSLATSAPEPVVPCQNYAWQCKFEGGPCGPQNACHCAFDSSTGWTCAR